MSQKGLTPLGHHAIVIGTWTQRGTGSRVERRRELGLVDHDLGAGDLIGRGGDARGVDLSPMLDLVAHDTANHMVGSAIVE